MRRYFFYLALLVSIFLPQTTFADAIPTPAPDTSNCRQSTIIDGRITQPGFPGIDKPDCPKVTASSVVNKIIDKTITIVFPLLTALAVIFLLYSSILYITARSDPEAAKKARRGIVNTVFGLVLILTVYIILGLITQGITFFANKF